MLHCMIIVLFVCLLPDLWGLRLASLILLLQLLKSDSCGVGIRNMSKNGWVGDEYDIVAHGYVCS